MNKLFAGFLALIMGVSLVGAIPFGFHMQNNPMKNLQINKNALRPLGLQPVGADWSISLGRNGNNQLNLQCQLRNADETCRQGANNYAGFVSFSVDTHQIIVPRGQEMAVINSSLILIDARTGLPMEIPMGVDTFFAPYQGYSKFVQVPFNAQWAFNGWSVKVCNTLNNQCYQSRPQPLQAPQ